MVHHKTIWYQFVYSFLDVPENAQGLGATLL